MVSLKQEGFGFKSQPGRGFSLWSLYGFSMSLRVSFGYSVKNKRPAQHAGNTATVCPINGKIDGGKELIVAQYHPKYSLILRLPFAY